MPHLNSGSPSVLPLPPEKNLILRAPFLNRLQESMPACQDSDSRFHDILDEPDSFPDGTSQMKTAVFVTADAWRGKLAAGRQPGNRALPRIQ